ncbi:uncharacterized protein LTHEOB_619 [Lasiodiplodia theobromae]|uniref:uncharacterized protein n=1 Tax=Lasiodiplodia theobromae TaxID=45133 RepID=UPI0015C36A9D|nr:uncharacterized protein LTHEOB_619 [Lasiodiplodia theobromae]KAF4540677.1 hypothetical protein LTHEOB_619 [Lasiodiplodia theobromae]
MMNTLSECEVKPMFLDVVLKFGDQEAIFEESSGFRETYQQANGSFDLCYQLISHFKPEELQSLRNLEDKVVFRALSGLRSSIVLIQAALGLLANLLDMQSKESSDQINKHMLQLTRESVDDNATVKVITVCTLIYLPASFTATLLGMNLFEFESNDVFTIQLQ